MTLTTYVVFSTLIFQWIASQCSMKSTSTRCYPSYPTARYGKDLLLFIETKKVNPPSLCCHQPVYHHIILIMIVYSSHTIMMIHLILKAYSLPIWKSCEFQWGAMDSVNYKISNISSPVKDKHLKHDSPTSIRQYYASIKIFLQVANKKNMDILSKLPELSPLNSLGNSSLPPPSRQTMVAPMYTMISLVMSPSTSFARVS